MKVHERMDGSMACLLFLKLYMFQSCDFTHLPHLWPSVGQSNGSEQKKTYLDKKKKTLTTGFDP